MNAHTQFYNAYGIKLTEKKRFEILAAICCLEMVVAFSSLGFISLPPISVTTLHILAIVAAMYFGPLDAAVVAAVFAGASMWKATVTSTEIGDVVFSPFISGKPFESVVMALGTRVAFAVLAGFLFRWFFSRERKHRGIWIAAISVLSTLAHSELVYFCLMEFFDAAGTKTGEGFSRDLLINNLLLYALTVLIVLLFDSVMKNEKIRDFFEVTYDNAAKEKVPRTPAVVSVLTALFVIFISLHFMSRLNTYIQTRGSYIDSNYVTWIYALLTQSIMGFGAVFALLGIFYRWNREYYLAMTLIADRKARESAESANKSKSNFLFNMSHDIRTPLNAVMGFTDIARKHIDDKEKVLDCLDKTQQSGNVLLTLINSVLEVSRIESGNATLSEQPGDVFYSFVNIENTMREMADAKNIELTFDVQNVKDRYILCDISRCMRVFVNIISNAIKYTPEGGTVKVSCEEVGEPKDGIAKFRYTVADNGIGMSEEFQKHIFDQFTRERNSTVSGIQGTGLGMAVVKSFVDLMGGTIAFQSKEGEGTTFTVVLPFKVQDEEKYTDPVTGDVISAGDAEEEYKEGDFSGRKVLLVEDNELNREIANEILSDEGMEVEEAEDGTVAVNLLREKGPCYYDFILMDIQMPVMGGFEATKVIREMYPGSHVPIIALSANAFTEDRAAALAAGMDDHVAKPIQIKELFAVISKFLN